MANILSEESWEFCSVFSGVVVLPSCSWEQSSATRCRFPKENGYGGMLLRDMGDLGKKQPHLIYLCIVGICDENYVELSINSVYKLKPCDFRQTVIVGPRPGSPCAFLLCPGPFWIFTAQLTFH
jgi:hypothetical protein